MTTYCLNCGQENNNLTVHHDELGAHCVCPACKASYPVDDSATLTRKAIENGVFLRDGAWGPWFAGIHDGVRDLTVSIEGAILEKVADELRHAVGAEGMDTDMEMWYEFSVQFYECANGLVECDYIQYEVENCHVCHDSDVGYIELGDLSRDMVYRINDLLRKEHNTEILEAMYEDVTV